jgi:PAS domain S-box-containing protein
MSRFRDLRIRTKLTLVLIAVVLPLVLGEVMTIRAMQSSLRDSAETELSNHVKQLYRITVLSRARMGTRNFESAPAGPEVIRFIMSVFRETRFGRTGYPYIMDPRGTLIIHPSMVGQNIYESRDSAGRTFIKEICRKAVRLNPGEIGTIRYPWRNVEGGETVSRMKIVKYMYFKEWNWIVAAGAYEDEIYAPIRPAMRSTMTLVGASLLLGVLLIWVTSRLIARPVAQLCDDVTKLAAGNLEHATAPSDGKDELGVLGRLFAKMATQIRQQKEDLEQQVEARTRELNDFLEQYRNLVENAVDCIVTADMSGTITFVNSGMENLLGLPRASIVGRKIWEFYRGGLERARQIMSKIQLEGSVRIYEQRLIAGERLIPIMTSATMLFDSDGQPVGTMGIFTDITKLKELEEELSEAQVNLAQTHKLRALGDLVAGVAHEVNNPLMASTTMLRVIERDLTEEDSRLRSQVHVLQKCNQRITKIVNHLREFSRQGELEKKRINVNIPLSNALLISKQQLMNMQIEIEQELGDDLPDIFADANLLEQVFLDLFANARDAMEGQERVKVLRIKTRHEDQAGNPVVVVEIQDTGCGVPQDIQDKIFEPFFTTKPVGQGTGLGLPICYGIIENHSGQIELTSSAESGTTISLHIPAMPDQVSVTADGEHADESQDTAN